MRLRFIFRTSIIDAIFVSERVENAERGEEAVSEVAEVDSVATLDRDDENGSLLEERWRVAAAGDAARVEELVLEEVGVHQRVDVVESLKRLTADSLFDRKAVVSEVEVRLVSTKKSAEAPC